MKRLFYPEFLDRISYRTALTITIVQLIVIVMFAQFNTNELIPKPSGIAHSIVEIIFTSNFLNNFFATMGLILTGMGMAILISLVFCYMWFIKVLKNFPIFVSKLRFLTYTGLLFVFTILVKDGHDIKISLLLFGIVPYFVTSLLAYIKDIPSKEYELCYSLKFTTWKTLYEVIIRGKLNLVLEVIKQNFAIAWMMITSVEGICMSEGGLGTMMIKSNKYLKIDEVFAVLIIVFFVGIFFDYFFDLLKVWLFPYTDTRRYNGLAINRMLTHKHE